MQTQMVTSKSGGELISFKLNGTERIHQGADCVDENGKLVLSEIVSLKDNFNK